ncbi:MULTISPECIES: YkvA family protein [unclassified Microbacterium]|uniref:YkvA family protein n=1 Tax=Microbacterium TaxID=33882 RepID=UPI003BA279C9
MVDVRVGGWEHECCGEAIRRGDHVRWTCVRNGERLHEVHHVIRLIRRLAADRTVPRPTRWWLLGLLGYLLLPIDLVPDVIPVLGYADDVIVVVLVLRHAIRTAGREPIERHWPGSEDGLGSLLALLGMRSRR